MTFLVESARNDTSGGFITIDDICHGAEFWAIEAGGVMVGAFATKLVHYERGAVLFIQACAANVPGVALSASIVNIWEKIAMQCGASQIGFETVRKGAVKVTEGMGFEAVGVMMRKNIGGNK